MQRMVMMVPYGVAGWFAAALLLRWLGPAMFDTGARHAILYLVSALIAWPTIWLGARIIGAPMHRMLAPTALFTGTAAACDGLALVLLPGLYGGAAQTGHAGAVILFGVGALLVLALVLERQSTGTTVRRAG
jgi:hypothetical protein